MGTIISWLNNVVENKVDRVATKGDSDIKNPSGVYWSPLNGRIQNSRMEVQQ